MVFDHLQVYATSILQIAETFRKMCSDYSLFQGTVASKRKKPLMILRCEGMTVKDMEALKEYLPQV